MDQSITGRMLVKKLFKLLSLLRLFRELRYTMRGHGHHRGHYGAAATHHYMVITGTRVPRLSPLYGRRRKPKLSTCSASFSTAGATERTPGGLPDN
jgi:hypothetical protein